MSVGAVRAAAVGAFVLLLAAIVAIAGRDTPLAQSLAAVSIAIVVMHAFAAFGPVDALAFVAVCLVVTAVVENIGIATGVPFGHYAFLVGAGLPHAGRVPLIVGPLYVGMGYPSWVIADLLLIGRVERPSDRMALFGMPVAAAFVMVQWDVVMDPSGSTLARAWVWYDGGGYFGVLELPGLVSDHLALLPGLRAFPAPASERTGAGRAVGSLLDRADPALPGRRPVPPAAAAGW